MLDTRRANKIKNEKILQWRIELAPFSYTILHRSGKENGGLDTQRRADCGAININQLRELHVALCHPAGITRMAHFVRTGNLPYSLSEIREMTSCKEWLEIKPQFFNDAQLVKATQIFERLNIDFKGLLPGVSNNRYIWTVIETDLKSAENIF